MEQCCAHRFGCNYRFVQVIKKDHNYALPSSKETIQLLQEMGMKYRENVTTFKNVKKKLEKTVKDLQDTLKTACQKYSIQESTMELLMASASQTPVEIFQKIGKKRKSSVKSNTESYHPALRTFALTLHLYSAQAYSLVKHILSSLEGGGRAHTT